MPLLLFLCFLSISAQAQLFPAPQEGRWGCIDSSGAWVISPEYDYIEAFGSNGQSRVLQKGKLGLIDQSGNWLLPCHYPILHPLANRGYLVKNEGRLQLINGSGACVLDSLESIPQYLSFGFFRLYDPKRRHYLAHRSKGQLHAQALKSISIVQGLAFVRIDSLLGVMDSTGRWIAPPRYRSFNWLGNRYFLLKNAAGEWLFDENGLLQETAWQSIRLIPNRSTTLLQVRDSSQSRLLRLPENRFLGPAAEAFYPLDSQHTAYQQQGKWGILNEQTGASSPCFADSLSPLRPGFFRAKIDDKWGICDARGKWQQPAIFSSISEVQGAITLAQQPEGYSWVLDSTFSQQLRIEESPLEVEANKITYRNDKTLLVWNFTSAGKNYEREEFGNFQRLQINNRYEGRRDSPLQIRRIDRRGGAVFQLFRSQGDSSRPVSPPVYENMFWPDSLPRFMVGIRPNSPELRPKEKGQPSPLDLYGIGHRKLYDLFDAQTGRRLIRLQELFLQDFQQAEVARCVFTNGRFGMIDKSGKVVAENYRYVRSSPAGTFIAVKDGKWEISESNSRAPEQMGLVKNLSFGIYAQFPEEYRHNEEAWAKIIEGKWQLLDRKGQSSLPIDFDFLDDFYNGQAIARKGKWGIIDAAGTWLLPPQYDAINWIEGSFQSVAVLSKNVDRWGLLDLQGRVALPPLFDAVRPAQEELFAVRQANKWGFARKGGAIVIPCQFQQVKDFSDGLAAVRTNKGWGYIRPDGSWQLPPQYRKAGSFSRGHSWVKDKGQVVLIDRSGQRVWEKDFVKAQTAGFGLFWLRDQKRWRLYNAQGKSLFKGSYQTPGIFDAQGQALIPLGKREVLIDTRGKIVERRYKNAHPMEDTARYRIVQERFGGTKLYDAELDTAYEAPPYLQLMQVNQRGLLANVKEQGYRLLDLQLIPLHLDYFSRAFAFEGDLARVEKGFTHSVLHPTGLLLQSFKYNQIRAFEKGYAPLRLYREKGIYRARDQRVLAQSLDYVQLVAPGIFRLEQGQKVGYLHQDGRWIRRLAE